ncbi:hypothetical protein LTR10_014455 [Elasticomyces elasticus]|uniref:Uncharacterized protein n=1 Tax=Exophiala sideris TaxID=1016849 RepID=A0ABR0J0J8_9EURO|nr:hypothetical protein LTR10_014455 [Elasticomyces elasticus]KAK5023631.1 hypothetical protein LTS07_009139 [Exophiala sideris]KAK5029631.1 hypothetical protein LTR13_008551 [Exophiala sideris]KAK5053420.1 hypothetical protein LTR69_009378 [Exophiala sideris]KAK5179178.1 hypothetical protein LTR44_008332 [Eurotiomycetes sp. CCFEE 6388]
MEDNIVPCKDLFSFSERATTIANARKMSDFDERSTQEKVPNLQSFQNILPPDEPNSIKRKSLIRQLDHHFNEGHDHDLHDWKNRNLFKTILIPTTVICLPMALLSAALLTIVYLYKVDIRASLFAPALSQQRGTPHVLVNFSATRLLFLASFLSTVAPLLGSFIMALCSLSASQELSRASTVGEYLKLPTPFQMSLLVGMLVASSAQLRSYLSYGLFRRQRPSMPPVLHYAASMIILSVLMATCVFIADTVLHYTTSTVELDQIHIPTQPVQELGRGISEFCLTYNRTSSGFPCSVEWGFTDPNYVFEQEEAVRLAHNTSQLSQIQMATVEEISGAEVAYLIPQDQTVTPNSDYQSTTIGVSTTCQFVPPQSCGMAVWGPDDIYTNFSCTDMFHGTLGIDPNTSTANGYRAPDAYRSLLMYKPASNLMYSFFSDPHLENVYNTVGLGDDGQFNLSILPLPDNELVNPFYIGVAARVAQASFFASSEMLTTNDTYRGSVNQVIDLVMNCAISSYDMTYTWVNGSLNSISSTPSNNGSILEIYHGTLIYTSVSGQADSFDLQDFLIQAPLSGNTTESFLRKFSSLYSGKVLAKIGAYTTARTVLQEQQRQSMLLSKVPIPALSMLVTWSFAYTVLGLVVAVRAYRASHANVRDIAANLSLLGLLEAAFGDHSAGLSSPGGGSSSEDLVQTSRKETRRVIVEGAEFKVMV